MSHQAFIEYLMELVPIYKKATKAEKTDLLNHAQKITKKGRRTLKRHLSVKRDEELMASNHIQGRGRKLGYAKYRLMPDLRALWILMEQISAVRMKAALPDWLPYYTPKDLTPELREQILKMSASTLHRYLSEERNKLRATRGLATTTSAKQRVKARVPIRTLDEKITQPGFLQADTVSHCGTCASGPFLSSVTLTDVFSTWTECRAIKNKKARHVRKMFIDIHQTLPFDMKSVNTDSGSEFINTPIIEYMKIPHGGKKIHFTRSRPYKKNDNCYVEQKNYTHVRQLFGYGRFEDADWVDLMNDIYKNYWNPLHNFFLPSQKLIEKVRVGAKIIKKFDQPKTPFHRLMQSAHVTSEQKLSLQKQRDSLNPIDLKKGLERQLSLFFTRLNQLNFREAA